MPTIECLARSRSQHQRDMNGKSRPRAPSFLLMTRVVLASTTRVLALRASGLPRGRQVGKKTFSPTRIPLLAAHLRDRHRFPRQTHLPKLLVGSVALLIASTKVLVESSLDEISNFMYFFVQGMRPVVAPPMFTTASMDSIKTRVKCF